MAGRNENLFDLVPDHRHEAGNGAAVGSDHGVGDPVSGPRAERPTGPNRHEFVRHMAQVTVPPAVMPNLGHDGASEARAGRSSTGMIANLLAPAALFHSLTEQSHQMYVPFSF